MDNITNKLSMHVDMDNFIPATADEKSIYGADARVINILQGWC